MPKKINDGLTKYQRWYRRHGGPLYARSLYWRYRGTYLAAAYRQSERRAWAALRMSPRRDEVQILQDVAQIGMSVVSVNDRMYDCFIFAHAGARRFERMTDLDENRLELEAT